MAVARPARVLLVGAGHAHLHLLTQAARFRQAGCALAMVSPRWFRYSGTATAVLDGTGPAEQGCLAAAALAARHGVPFHDGEVAQVDRSRQQCRAGDGTVHDYDLVSFNIGSRVRVPAGDAMAYAAKPLADLLTVPSLGDAAVLGGGATGIEIACALARPGVRRRVQLVAPSGVGVGLPCGARGVVVRTLAELGIQVVSVRDGTEAFAVHATGLHPPPLMRSLGLTCAGDGALSTDATLCSPDDPRVFAVGDCAHFQPRPLPRVGVYGVRAAPVLAANLIARAQGRSLKPFRPQRSALSILNLGVTGLAVRGRWWWAHPLMLRWKGHIDQQWLQRYR